MNKISVGMIVKNDPHIEKCILSIKDHIDELVIVDTGSTDNTPEICKKYADVFETYTACNNPVTGLIEDFAMARNRSMALANPEHWFMWLDSDDIVSNMQNIRDLISTVKVENDGFGFIFPYEYSYNTNGIVNCKHYRERLISNVHNFHFINPVHEVLVPKDGKNISFIKNDDIIIKHQRQFTNKPQEPARNLRILKSYVEKNPDDVRNMYYIGLEYFNNGEIGNSIKYLEMYVDKSGWDDERAMACYKLVDIYLQLNNFKMAQTWAFKSLQIKSDWFESYYAICKVYYHTKEWKKCVDFGKLALTQAKTETFLFIDEGARFEIHTYLNVALNNIGDVQGALDSVNLGLSGIPNHPNLLHNKNLFHNFLNIKPEIIPLKEIDVNHLNIIFVTGQSLEEWTPETVQKTGIGGSELMMIHQAKNLAALGHQVKVYNSCGNGEGIYDGVEYLNLNKYRDLSCDILIVSRFAPLLGDEFNVNAHLKLLWLHDVCAIGATNELLLKADRILCLSNWHKENVVKVHNLNPEQIIVTRNGIDLTRFANKDIKRDQYKCVNSSSPDRSWPVLLEIWPEIKKQVPNASLHLYYGFFNWKKSAQHDSLQMDLIQRLENRIEELKPLDVVFHDRICQDKLANEFLSAGAWLHSTWFQETSCISAMEIQAAGLHPITSSIGALNETILDKSCLIDGDWTSKEYQDKFIKKTVEALTCNERHYPLVDKFDILTLAQEWHDIFLDLLKTTKEHPIIPYQPTPAYITNKKELVKLNIAAGPNVFPFDGWINYDKENFKEYFDYISNPKTGVNGMPEYQKPLAQYLQSGGKLDFRIHNMTEPFDHNDNSVDVINVGQAIEHLNYVNQAPAFIKECYRMLKPGGLLRMSTPDFNLILNAYNRNEMQKFAEDQPAIYKELDPMGQMAMLIFGASGDNCNQNNYEGHFFCYTEKSMTQLLEKAGFKEIEFYNWNNQSKVKEIKEQVKDHGLSHSFVVECIK